jgi:hypothetical protein
MTLRPGPQIQTWRHRDTWRKLALSSRLATSVWKILSEDCDRRAAFNTWTPRSGIPVHFRTPVAAAARLLQSAPCRSRLQALREAIEKLKKNVKWGPRDNVDVKADGTVVDRRTGGEIGNIFDEDISKKSCE